MEPFSLSSLPPAFLFPFDLANGDNFAVVESMEVNCGFSSTVISKTCDGCVGEEGEKKKGVGTTQEGAPTTSPKKTVGCECEGWEVGIIDWEGEVGDVVTSWDCKIVMVL